MSHLRAICLGEILFDCLADRVGTSREEVQNWTRFPGGAPGNVASGLMKLGTPAAFIGCVGQDADGEELVRLLQRLDVDCRGVQYHPTAPTREVYVLRQENGDRLFADFGENAPDTFADAYLDSSQLPVELFQAAEYLVIGTLELAYPQTRESVFRALELADEYYLKIVLDVNLRRMFWVNPQESYRLISSLWQAVDFIKFSGEEARYFFGTADATTIFYEIDSAEGVIVTNGGSGNISYCLTDNSGAIAPFNIPVKDTTGAGDAFVAGLIHQFCQRGIGCLQDADMAREIVTYAAAVGAIATTRSGAMNAQPTASEVDIFLQNNG
ncbi:carbohydrate kinase [Spirulina sp. 06S082]|uniref:carbohydrate kinase family protein n=1 Tax=Spirulina sp. 06S082 TaxID=3110248 RepID=UPI002B21DA64|nr:carbohydrate kinase [Spirulina sp. 06S082]MEA5471985.1 carbohydrate kinase [Spirulina sp. 06S082]